jgi:membrane fusion protein, multidrug efflux system
VTTDIDEPLSTEAKGNPEAERFSPAAQPRPFDDAGLAIHEKGQDATALERGGPQQKAEHERDDRPPQEQEAPGLGARIRSHPIITAIIIVLILAVGLATLLWWLNARHYEDTDDAFIDARPSAISAQVSGAIVDVPVTDNQLVEDGATLATIDARDYQAALGQAQAQIAQAQAAIASARAQSAAQQARIDQTSRQVTEAQAALTFSKDQDDRAQALVKTGAGTVQQAQQTSSDLRSKQAAQDAAIAGLAEAQKQLAVLDAQRQSAEGQLLQARAQSDQALANLSRVTLIAPFRGRVTKLTAARGAYATPGQTLMMIVPLDLWVTANFRETQLADMRPGQPVTIGVDVYGRSFSGHVDSIQAGSGTAFSLLPAENATGNYVKVVQRVPVKIVFDRLPDLELGPGLSVTPSVKVR